jgi:hypothetical protein
MEAISNTKMAYYGLNNKHGYIAVSCDVFHISIVAKELL